MKALTDHLGKQKMRELMLQFVNLESLKQGQQLRDKLKDLPKFVA